MRNFKFLSFLAATVLFMNCGRLHADNWPQWRNDGFASVSSESNLPESLDKTTQVWRTELPGHGGASPVVWGDSLFVTSSGDGNALWLLHYSTAGNLRWKKQLPGKNQMYRDKANSASPSPFTDGKHVWCMMTNGILQCFDYQGEKVWSKDLQKEYGRFDIQFGMSSTPILEDGKIYIQLVHGNMRDQSKTSEGWLVCLDANSGNENWKFLRKTDGIAENKHAYTSPVLFGSGANRVMVVHGGDYITGHSLIDGNEVWRCGGINTRPGYNPFLRFVASPTPTKEHLIVPTAKRGMVFALKPGESTGDLTGSSAISWKMERGTPDVSCPLLYDGHIYLAGESQTLTCLNADTGEIVYKQNRFLQSRQRSTPVAGDGKVYIAEREGQLTVLKAGAKFEVLSRFELDEQVTASPAISNGVVYVRSSNALYAFAAKKKNTVADNEKMKFAIAIHGGAGSASSMFPGEANRRRRESMKQALQIGTDILKAGGTSLEAVEKVVVFLENDPQFNAGVGAVFNAADSHELDASIMDGNGLKCGAVCGVTTVKNPITLARLVMTDTRHVLLSAKGAEAFAQQMEQPLVSPDYFDTPATKSRWEKRKSLLKQRSEYSPQEFERRLADLNNDSGSYQGTVGCVALDSQGNLAAATSTGGMTNKKFGRVGDSPIVGAGTYADNRTCAVSGTGIGEQYIRNAVAYDVSAQMLYKKASLEEAVQDNLKNRLNKNDGGIIAVDKDGNISMEYNTAGMARAAADSNGRFEVLW